jgi:hypothetical protein
MAGTVPGSFTRISVGEVTPTQVAFNEFGISHTSLPLLNPKALFSC